MPHDLIAAGGPVAERSPQRTAFSDRASVAGRADTCERSRRVLAVSFITGLYCNLPARSRPMRSRATASGVVPQQAPGLPTLHSDSPTG
jgi:hypothetical protein